MMNAALALRRPAVSPLPVDAPSLTAPAVETAITHQLGLIGGFRAAVAQAHLDEIMAHTGPSCRAFALHPKKAVACVALGTAVVLGSAAAALGIVSSDFGIVDLAACASIGGMLVALATAYQVDDANRDIAAKHQQVKRDHVSAVADFVRELSSDDRAWLMSFVDADLARYRTDGSFSLEAADVVSAEAHKGPAPSAAVAHVIEAASIVDTMNEKKGNVMGFEIKRLSALFASCPDGERSAIASAVRAILFRGDTCVLEHAAMAEANQLAQLLRDNAPA